MPAPTTLGPAEALRRLADHREEDTWEWLLQEMGPSLQRVIRRLSLDGPSAEDAFQECLLQVRDHAGQFVPREDPDSDARAWLLRVAALTALQWSRAQQRRRRHEQAAPAGTATPPPPPEARLERHEEGEQVQEALARLREPERAAIVLHVVGGLTVVETARALGWPLGTAKIRIHRGLARLRAQLGRAGALLPLTDCLRLLPAVSVRAADAATRGLLHAPLTAGSLPAALAATTTASALASLLASVVTCLLAVASAVVVTGITPHPLAGADAAPPAPTPASPATASTSAPALPAEALLTSDQLRQLLEGGDAAAASELHRRSLRTSSGFNEHQIILACLLVAQNDPQHRWPATLAALRASLTLPAVVFRDPSDPQCPAPYCYVRPATPPDDGQPVLVEDPACNRGEGSMVAFGDCHIEYVRDPRYWQAAQRLAAAPPATGVPLAAWVAQLPSLRPAPAPPAGRSGTTVLAPTLGTAAPAPPAPTPPALRSF